MVTVRCSQWQHFTPPKIVDPVIVSWPVGASPSTVIVCGLPGSLLVTVMLADLGPKLVGRKRIGAARKFPPAIRSGYDNTWGTRNSGDDDVIPLIVSAQWLLLFKISGSSEKDPTQTLPKCPVSAIIKLSRDVWATPVTRIVCGLAGSLLVTVSVAALLPGLVGSKRNGIDSESPAPTVNG